MSKSKKAPLVKDVITAAKAAHYDSLNDNEYLDAVWGEMKALWDKCDFESRKNPPDELLGGIPYNMLYWPKVPAQTCDYDGLYTATKVDFYVPAHKMVAMYEGSFHIKNAVIRAKFTGDKRSHSFYIGEHDKLNASVIIGANDEDDWLAIMVDGRIPKSEMAKFAKMREPGGPKRIAIEHETAEFDEFTMLAVTDGRYYKNYMEPRAVNEDLAIFTCFNKARRLYRDTVASFKNGLCEPESIFSGSSSEDVPAEWANHLTK